MKLGATVKLPPQCPPCHLPDDSACSPSAPHGGGQPTFFAHVVRTAGMTRKEVQYDLRLSKTYVDSIMSGEKLDPFSRVRDVCAILHGRKRGDLVVSVLLYIAGLEFDGSVLTAVQVEAIRELSKVVQPK